MRYRTFSEIIDLWDNSFQLAEDLSDAKITCSPDSVRSWKHRDNITAPWWNRVVKAARKRKHPVTLLDLANIAEQQIQP